MQNATSQALSRLHRSVSRAFVPFLWLHVPIMVAVAQSFGNAWLAPSIVAAVVASVATAAWLLAPDSQSSRLTIAVAQIAMVSLLLVVTQHNAWQNDIHIYYLASLAMLAVYCDRNVVLAGAAATAVHHLGMNFLAPALVFPGGAQLGRVVFHAVIVVLETGALVWMTSRIVTLLAIAAHNLETTIAASNAARNREEEAALGQRRLLEAERTRVEHERLETLTAQNAVVLAIGTGLEKLSKGDLSIRLHQPFAAAYEPLRNNFNTATTQLHALVKGIAANIAGLEASTSDIAQTATDLSSRTEQQAAGLEETAAALDQITATVSKTADGAAHTREVVLQTKVNAEHSGDIVRQAVTAMAKIEGSSTKIGQIVGVIDEIAFQTNLLALNAGVEAARAGDTGRGFAVVASEVRALAQRSAAAAKEIKSLITTSTQEVGSGVRLVRETGQALTQILVQIAEIDTIVGGIAASARDQAGGLADVNAAISKMDQATQLNVGMVEQSTSASYSVAREAEELAKLTTRFHLGNHTGRAATTTALPRLKSERSSKAA